MMAAWTSKADTNSGTFVLERSLFSNASSDFRPLLETTMLALHVIMGAGYGVPFTWDKVSDAPWPNHRLTFQQATLGLVEHLLPIVLIPKFLWQVPLQRMKRMKRDYEEFGQYLRDLLDQPQTSQNTGRGENLVSALARSAEMEKGDGVSAGGSTPVRLTDEQILGNAFMILVAGHETTYPLSPNCPPALHTYVLTYICTGRIRCGTSC